MTAPAITVIICSYNAGDYLQASVASVVAQTLADWELLLIDDGSTDGSTDFVARLADARIRLVRHASNQGIAASRTEGLLLARGRYCCWLDADDVALPQRLALQVQALDAEPELVLCAMHAHQLSADGLWQYSQGHAVGNDALKACLFFRFPFVNSSVAMRTAVAQACVSQPVEYKQAEDYVLYCRMSHRGRFISLAEAGIGYRVHQTATRITDDRNNADIVHGRMIAWRQLLAQLQLPAPAHEVLLLHDKLSYYRERITASDMAQAGSYLQLLADMQQQNATQGLLDEALLAQEISARVYSLLIHARLELGACWQLGRRYQHLLLPAARRKWPLNKLRRWLLRMPH